MHLIESPRHATAARLPVKPLSACLIIALHGLAAAQQSEPEAPRVTSLPEVKVTGQSTGEIPNSYTVEAAGTATPLNLSPRETPQSISVVTPQRIEDQNLRNITDVVNSVTGLSVHQYETSRGQFTARGFDINTLMIDGTPTTWEQPWSSGEIFTSMALFDRVEVVRGATGLVTGAGEPSAAVNMVRKRASARQLTGLGEAEVGNWNEWRVLGDVATPLNAAGTVRVRVVGEYWDRDSWVDLLSTTTKTAFATVEADLTPDTLLTAGLSRQDNDSDSPMWGGLPAWYDDGSPTDWDVSKTTSARWARWNTSYDNYYARLEHRFASGWKAAAYFTQGKREADSYLLYLFGAPNRTTGLGLYTWPGSYLVNTDQKDASVTASGPFQLGGRSHELAFGYVYSKQDFNAQSRSGGAGGAAPDFNTWDGSVAEPVWGDLAYYGNGETKQQALYAVTRLSLADPLRLILGARVTRFEQSGDDAFSEPYSMKFDNEVTPYAGITLDFGGNYTAYASYTDIFQPQIERDINGDPLQPIVGKAGEIGIKGEFFDGRLNTSAAVFYIRQDNLAQASGETIPGTSPPEPAYYASRGATSEGFELDASGEVAPDWNVGVGYSQFKLTDADGKDVNTVYPRKLFKLFTTYQFQGAARGLTLGGGVNWESRTYTVAMNPLGVEDRIEQGSFALVGLMARYQFTDRLSAQLNVDNVFDQKYRRMFDAFAQTTYGAPRSATLSARYAF